MWIFLVCGHNPLAAGKGRGRDTGSPWHPAVSAHDNGTASVERPQKGSASALFPGYLFVHINPSPETTLRVRKVPAIVDFVGNHSGPLPIPDGQIENVRTALARGVPCSPHSFLEAGARVRVVRGALAGIEGGFVRNGSKGQLIISIEMIQRSLALTVFEEDVEPLTTAAQGISKDISKPQVRRLAS